MSQEIFNNVIETVCGLSDEAQNEIIKRIIENVSAQRQKKLDGFLHDADVIRDMNGRLSSILSGNDEAVSYPTPSSGVAMKKPSYL